jgi:hypothetical protein
LIRGHERWNRDLGGVRGSGSWSKDTGVLSTDVSVSEHDEDEDTEKGTRKRKVVDKVKGNGREQGVAERPPLK